MGDLFRLSCLTISADVPNLRAICGISAPAKGRGFAAVAGGANVCTDSANSGIVLEWAGKQWDSISAGLPNGVPFVLIDAPDDKTVFVATWKRVYATHNAGNSWSEASSGLPETPHATDLYYALQPDGKKYLYLATYGRSMWRTCIIQTCK